MHSQSRPGLPRAGFAGHELPSFNQVRIVPPDRNCVSDPLRGHQLVTTVGWFNLWKQVQKAGESVDFTIIGA
jgi:hypothetical protein